MSGGVFRCPVCAEPLQWEEKRAVCGRGHAFDLAKEGYVNLLQSQASSRKRHGDDKLMLAARQRFLAGGYYDFLLDAVADAAARYLPEGGTILDVGCGEGYYTEGIYRKLSGRPVEIAAVDVSKEAAKRTAKRNFPKTAAVASAYALPVGDGRCDALISIFAPVAAAEFTRVLKPGGVLIRAVPREGHLWGLKAAIYDKPYRNPPVEQMLEGFRAVEKIELDRTLCLNDPADIEALFRMTPYYYKTSAADQERAAALQRLETEISFAVLIDKKA